MHYKIYTRKRGYGSVLMIERDGKAMAFCGPFNDYQRSVAPPKCSENQLETLKMIFETKKDQWHNQGRKWGQTPDSNVWNYKLYPIEF